MIILKHLTVEHFRLLREIDLHFPQRGSILIQGPNEAGKSALLESIYFALYGEPLAVSARSKRPLDDLISYGAAQASVDLTLSIGATELAITRVIERGKGQQATVQVRRLGMPEETPITRLNSANERIIAELGHMDGETLRNSCFIEQKGLGRLENLPGSQREATARKLLGLEKLIDLTAHFKVTPEDEQALALTAERLKLAELQARIPLMSQRLSEIEAALDAITVSEDLAEITQQEAEIAEQELSIEQLQEKRVDCKTRQNRIRQLRKADIVLSEIISAYEAMAEAQHELPEIERQLLELERREHEELPALEKRVHDLADLTRSFGTLERMSNDLLSAVGTIRDLEQELKQQQELQEDSDKLDEQLMNARQQVDQARQSLVELEERRRAGRPQLEARLQRLRKLAERVAALHQVEEQYYKRTANRGQSEENAAQVATQLAKVQNDLRETEHEQILVEAEAQQDQQQADALEKRWRQLSIRRQLEEWQRLKSLSEGMSEADQHVIAAHRLHENLKATTTDAAQATQRWMIVTVGSGVLGIILGVAAILIATLSPYLAAGMGLFALVLLAGAGLSLQNYFRSRKEEQTASQQAQAANNQLSMMMASRETALRMGGNRDAVAQVEHEIQSLGGPIPRSVEEAQQLMQQVQDKGESLADVQQQANEKRNAALASRNQVNVTLEAVAALRKERARLEEEHTQGEREDGDASLRTERISIQDSQNEIASLAGEEGLPIPIFEPVADPAIKTSTTGVENPATTRDRDGRPQGIAPTESVHSRGTESGGLGTHPLWSPSNDALPTRRATAALTTAIEGTIKGTEREIASIDGKLDLVSEMAEQAKIHQDALDILLARKQVMMERRERFQTTAPMQQIERAYEQQDTLRGALRSLQDSLRQRVRTLGVSFGQAAISNAEINARRQLEELHISLGSRVDLQSRRERYTDSLRNRQDSLSEYYNQLAKFSATLGSWIVPLNPFTEALAALRVRCQQEIQDAHESGILQELERLRLQENASNAKVALCRQDIEDARERIATMLTQHNRPTPKGYSFTEIVVIWPLVGEYTTHNRDDLEEECETIEQTLQQLEQQESDLSTVLAAQLKTSRNEPALALEQVQAQMEQQERSYQTKKRGSLLVQATSDRVMQKLLPRIEYHMQHILRLLTAGRYHDVHLTTDEEEETASGGPLQVQVWDTAAGEYIPRSALSGGAADQLSLALRLAFAIATLPRELNGAPGFVLLDEPLSSFDRGRAQALVDVVTGEALGQHFEQILLISHSGAFDPAMFPYHVYMDSGIIVESNLPPVPTLSSAKLEPEGASKSNGNTATTEPIALSDPIAIEG